MAIEVIVVRCRGVRRAVRREQFWNEIDEHCGLPANLGTRPRDDKRRSTNRDVECDRLRLDISRHVGHRHRHAIAPGWQPARLDDELLRRAIGRSDTIELEHHRPDAGAKLYRTWERARLLASVASP